MLKSLDEDRVEVLERLCEWLVPGSARVGPVVYIDAAVAGMSLEERTAALEAIDALGGAGSVDELSGFRQTPEFALVRALAIEAYYSDFVAPGSPGPGAWSEIDFQVPRAVDLERDWSWLAIT